MSKEERRERIKEILKRNQQEHPNFTNQSEQQRHQDIWQALEYLLNLNEPAQANQNSTANDEKKEDKVKVQVAR